MMRRLIFAFGSMLFCLNIQAQVIDASSIEGKWVCGYQAWFNALGDGSPLNRWGHWGRVKKNNPDTKLRPTFDIYPAIDEYADTDLYETDFENLGDGRKAKLFSSYKQSVIDKQFEWMQTYGIDGVALQRFIGAVLNNSDIKKNRDSIAAKVRLASEKYGRIFYMMYDISGLPANKFNALIKDWQTVFEKELDITSSSQYAHQDGKPVICIWGFGFNQKHGNQQQCLKVINWFKDHGYYVIGGVPTFWRNSMNDSKPDFNVVYDAYDMISPWFVGRFTDTAGADDFLQNQIIPDKAYCDSAGIAYQPVLFPGFSWFNLKKTGYSANQIPRLQGKFFWRQYYNLQSVGIRSYYGAMFDEYDEGTNYMKAADSYYDTPANRYFLTNSSDGKYVSSDFYLRLLGAANASRFSNDPVPKNHNVPLSLSPLYYRSSFEPDFDALPSNFELELSSKNMSGYESGDSVIFGPSNEQSRIGKHAVKFSFEDQSDKTSSGYCILADVNIYVTQHTYITFHLLPQTDLGKYVSIDIVCSDGTRLQDLNVMDINGSSMIANAQRGQLNQWLKFTIDLSSYLNGKTIEKVLIGYNHDKDMGKVIAFIDDMRLFTGSYMLSVD